ncbi:MAG TPA: fructose-6-phosphate aldolase [Candidatus Saccharimonadales bacterium]|nr:fructose-6-phosphate aldolase [Candidatus Saccharimonadales bacterium]
MKFFIDSANIPSIQKFVDMGVVDGVTTNPSLLSKEGVDPAEQAIKIAKLVPGPVNIEVVATDYEGMMREGKKIAEIGKNVVVKIPMTKEGMHAVKDLTGLGIKTNVTLIFSAPQALIAAKAGATYVSPFIGRLDDIGEDGLILIKDIVTIFRNYSIKAQLLAASIRHPVHLLECAKLGADVATLPPDVLEKLFMHPLTDAGIRKFLDDWEVLNRKLGGKIAPFKG